MAGEPKFFMQALFSRFFGFYYIDILEMIVTWYSFALVIAACSTPDFATFQSTYVNANIGLLTWRYVIQTPTYSVTSEWQYIDKTCTSTFKYPVGTQTMPGTCSTYMSFAVCLIIGIVLYGTLVALRTTVFAMKWYPHKLGKAYAYVTYFLAACTWLLPIANWIMYDMVLNDYKNGKNGASSALLTASWCLAFLAFLMCVFRHVNIERMDVFNQTNKLELVIAGNKVAESTV